MSQTIEVQEILEQPMLGIRKQATAEPESIKAALSDALPRVYEYIKEKDVVPASPPMCVFESYGADGVTLVGGAIVQKPVEGDGDIEAMSLPGGKVAVVMHLGSYDKLKATYEALQAWVQEHGHKPRGASWELYWTDPGEEPNPDKWKTEIFMPVE